MLKKNLKYLLLIIEKIIGLGYNSYIKKERNYKICQ